MKEIESIQVLLGRAKDWKFIPRHDGLKPSREDVKEWMDSAAGVDNYGKR